MGIWRNLKKKILKFALEVGETYTKDNALETAPVITLNLPRNICQQAL